MNNLLAVLLAVFVAAGTNGQKIEVMARVGENYTFDCNQEKHYKICGLSVNNEAIVNNMDIENPRFTIVQHNTNDCQIHVDNLQVEDTKLYSCHPGLKSFDLIVGVPPTKPMMRYNNEDVINGNHHVLVSPNDDNSAIIECFVENGIPKAKFEWKVNGIPQFPEKEEDEPTDGSRQTSKLKITFEERKQEYRVECIVEHKLWDQLETVWAVFGEAQRTTKSWLEIDNTNFIKPGEKRDLWCSGDGIPKASQFKIEKLDQTAEDKWVTIAVIANWTVHEAGTYRCQSRNYHEKLALDGEIPWATSDELQILEPGSEASPSSKADAGMIVGIVLGVLVILIIIIAVIAVLHRTERACFKPRTRSPPGVNVENGMKGRESEVPNSTYPPGETPRDTVNPATNHQ